MKKKYFAPELEELEIESPVLLAGSEKESETEGDKACTTDEVDDF